MNGHKPMRPLCSYYGGKQKMASKIVDLLPRHTVYVEPFCGGAAVFFRKPWPPATNTHHYREALNDRDNRIVNLYRVAQDPDLFEEFCRLVSVPYSRAVYLTAKERNKTVVLDPDDREVQAAADYWVDVQQSFGNELNGGWKTGVVSENHAATWANKLNRLPQYLDRMLSVYVECDDALAIIKRWDSPQTLFYCDPPYPGAHQGHYSGYTQADFEALCSALDNAQGSFVLSNYANEAPPKNWQRHEFEARSSAQGQGQVGHNRDKSRAATSDELGDRKRTEVLWVVDRSANARNVLQNVWTKWGWEEGVGMGQVQWATAKKR